ncbi:hypothetical protein [Nesterenkonia sp. CF4.4]|uniref:hypothetical protein n=1 Tax=Nesterenkonia sp. CF4.4 TaxID=3373079 RepID=UPI003EE6ED03
MEFTIPENCGNSPRMTIVAELARAWGADDQQHLDEWLEADASWDVHPGKETRGFTRLWLENVVTHGRVGSCDGVAVRLDGSRVHFAHFFTFASTVKTARVRSVTSYVVPSGAAL